MSKVTQQHMAEFSWELSLLSQSWNCANLNLAHEPSSAGPLGISCCPVLAWGCPWDHAYTKARSGCPHCFSSGSLGSPAGRATTGGGGQQGQL